LQGVVVLIVFVGKFNAVEHGEGFAVTAEASCREGGALFPSPPRIKMTCSCPDWAGKGVMYGAGAEELGISIRSVFRILRARKDAEKAPGAPLAERMRPQVRKIE
jgi:hypothetical protein